MDLEAMIAQQLTQQSRQQKQAAKDLIPQSQQNRSYTDTKTIPQSQQKLNLTTQLYTVGEKQKKWILQYDLIWPGAPIPTTQRQATLQQLKKFADDFISIKSYPGEEKYYSIKHIDKNRMQIEFDADKWIRDSFTTARQKFSPPLTLTYSGRVALPTLVYSNSPLSDFIVFLSERYEYFLKSKTNKLKHDQFGFLKRVSVDLFDYSYSFRENKFKATLKFSVVLASLAAYMIWKHKKDLSKSEIKSLQRKASNMKDVKKLDKYIKRL